MMLGMRVEDDLKDICCIRLATSVCEQTDEPSGFITEYTGCIIGGDTCSDTIGNLTLMVVQLEAAAGAGTSLLDVMDCHTSDLAWFAPMINRDGFVGSIEAIANTSVCPLLIIDRVSIQPTYRGFGLALKAIDIACRTVGLGCGLAALNAFPSQWLEKDEPRPRAFIKDRAKLMAYYGRAGFVKARPAGTMAKRLW
jgi:hypothetical protein